jgi:hypothetical protein
VIVYWDSVYSSFMFAFPTDQPVAVGTIRDASGKAVANAPVTLTDGGREFTTHTDAEGNYRFYDAPTGQGTITIGGTSHDVAVGPSEGKVSVKIDS